MQYRKFGRLDWDVSVLGFGGMRFPTTKDGKIDEAEATKMVYHAIDQGVNYIDTALPYHNGDSEKFLGKILQGEYRQKVKIATKMPSWAAKEASDFDKFFNDQLDHLQTDFVDVYLLHTLNKNWWPKLRDLGVLDWAEQKIKEGRIGHLGFSFHDDHPIFTSIVDDYDWDICQIQYNYMDIENQAGTKGLQYAASKGMAVIVMEPLLGGNLTNPPESIQSIWDKGETPRSSVDWALQWVWNHPEVSMLLSGMSSMQQLEENLESASKAGANSLTPADLELVAQVREKYRELRPVPCTQCEYCMPCPSGVNIPQNFTLYNNGSVYDNVEGSRGGYAWQLKAFELGLADGDARASSCVQCGVCDEKCPQQIPISTLMPAVHKVLGEGQAYQSAPQDG